MKLTRDLDSCLFEGENIDISILNNNNFNNFKKGGYFRKEFLSN
jgi:hypothetical protein